MAKTVYLSLGSNLGDRIANIESAIRQLETCGSIMARSSLYETEPFELKTQPWFVNAVLAMKTELAPDDLLVNTLRIEQKLGRVRTQIKGPRTLDIDILFFGDSVVNTAALTIPHPGIQERRFVLEPMAEIAPELIHPLLEKSVREMLQELPPGDSIVRKIAP